MRNRKGLQLQASDMGKNVSRYIAPDQAEATKQALDGYHKFQELTQRYAKAIIDQTRAELTASSKKKKSHPRRKSSSPKTKKSSN